MFLKDHLKDIYQKASFDKNYLMLENIINRWAHRFGIESLNELTVKDQDQDQSKVIEEDHEEENHNQISLKLLENVQHKKETDLELKETKKSNDTEILKKDTYVSDKGGHDKTEELPLPNINNLRKWINNEKTAS